MKNFVKNCLARHGWAVVRLGDPGAVYGRVLPGAEYRPWVADGKFQELYAKIRHATLVDVYRCWELWTLVPQLNGLPPGAIIEVGVWRGGTGAILAAAARQARIQETVFLCDTFQGVVKAGANDPYYRDGEHADTSREKVEELLVSLDLPAQILEGTFPEETGTLIGDQRVRLVHIDVDAYQSAKDIVTWAWPRVVPGGILVFDDFGFRVCGGIVQLVNELAGPKRLVLHNLNGHALVVKR
jgi:O-methyltransferase